MSILIAMIASFFFNKMQIGVRPNAKGAQKERGPCGIYVSPIHALTKLSSLCKEKPPLVFFQKCTKPIFEVSDVLMITVEIAPDGVKGVSLFFPQCGILRFGKNMAAPRGFLNNFHALSSLQIFQARASLTCNLMSTWLQIDVNLNFRSLFIFRFNSWC